jgi:hypothetical protein
MSQHLEVTPLVDPLDQGDNTPGPVIVTMEDIYNVLVDIHAGQQQTNNILAGFAQMINAATEEVPKALEALQDSPIFGMLSGSGGGILGSLFRR